MNEATDCRRPGAGVLVAQLGARRHYAVPLAFHAYAQLQCLCTDILLPTPNVGKVLRRASSWVGSQALRRLADRQSGLSLPSSLTRTFPLFGLRYKWQGERSRTAEERTANWIWGGEKFATMCAREIRDSTSAVYAFSSAAKELFEQAKKRGVSCWLDHATAPRGFEVSLIQEEAQRFPGWSCRSVDDSLTSQYLDRQREELALADLIICGSSFAKRATVAEGVCGDRVLVVPLGVADHLYASPRPQESNKHHELRVLYVGGDGLRKGIGYLALAVEQLASRSIEVRAAGDLELSEVAQTSLKKHMQLLGTVPRSDMPALFRWADVLVLPSISDTFGMVILEAMAAGLVVIASQNTAAPDILRNGHDGFVVPIRDANAIAQLLDSLAADRSLIQAIGEAARERAMEFTVSRYGGRLMDALGLAEPVGAVSARL